MAKISYLPARPNLFNENGSTIRHNLGSLRRSVPSNVIIRHASTTTDNADTPIKPLLSSSPFDTITPADLPAIPEQIGYLKALGLDYGWGPTAMIESLLEGVYVYSGLPWWGSITLTAIIVRTCIFPLYINATDVAARMQVIQPHLEPIKERLRAAKVARDTIATLTISRELRAVFRDAGIQSWRLAMPLIQVPLGYGTFRLMRGMASLPVPGLDNGGILWLKDLTISDPYFIMPIATASVFWYAFKKGGENGTTGNMDPTFRSLLQWGLPLTSFFFMLFWPGCMQLTFFTTALLSLGQGAIFRSPAFRAWLGVQPMPSPTLSSSAASTRTMTLYQAPDSPTTPAQGKGILGGAVAEIKGAASQVVAQARKKVEPSQTSTARLSKAELRRAKEYEERRRLELAEGKKRRNKRTSKEIR